MALGFLRRVLEVLAALRTDFLVEGLFACPSGGGLEGSRVDCFFAAGFLVFFLAAGAALDVLFFLDAGCFFAAGCFSFALSLIHI